MKSPPPFEPPSSGLRTSWERSRGHGLRSDQPLPDAPVPRVELSDRLEANARLLTFSRPVIENLYQQIGSPSSTVLLADGHGVILSTVGCPDFLDRAASVALSVGTQWREADMGTNAIGTALHTGRTVAVHGDEHYLDRNRFLACVATPILAPGGGIAGILDISTDARAGLSHANALLRTTAELIEHRLIESLDGGFLSIQFHTRPDLVGSPLEALVVFDEDGRLVASNRPARSLLALDPRRPSAQCHECFAISWAGLMGRAAVCQDAPFPLSNLSGRTYSARARLHATRHKATAGMRTTSPQGVSRLLAMRSDDARITVVIDTLRRGANTKRPFLIAGETGSGKTHLVHAFHEDYRSGPDTPLITLDCTTVSSDAGTAARETLAALRQASGGHLMLEQVGDLSFASQAGLFCAAATDADARLIATTTRPLAVLASERRFDFTAFEACGGQAVSLPPLRERSDFRMLVRTFVREFSLGRPIHVCPDAIELLRRHNWPGNLSELRSRLKLVVALMGDEANQLCPEDIPAEFLEDV